MENIQQRLALFLVEVRAFCQHRAALHGILVSYKRCEKISVGFFITEYEVLFMILFVFEDLIADELEAG